MCETFGCRAARAWARHFVTMLLVLLAPAAAAGQSSLFSISAPRPIGFQPTGLETADIDGDGDAEVLMLDGQASMLKLFANVPASCLLPPPASFAVTATPNEIVIADLEGDGDADVLVASSSTVSVLVNAQGILTRNDVAFATNSAPLAAADVNGDGLLDLHRGSSILLAAGSGFAATPTIPTGLVGLAGPFVTGDFDGDGDVDFASEVSTSGSPQIDLRLNDGTGNFGAMIASALSAGTNPGRLIAMNLDDDGIDDIARVRDDGIFIETRKGTPTGSFVLGPSFSLCSNNCSTPTEPLLAGRTFDDGTDALGDLVFLRTTGVTTPGAFVLRNLTNSFSILTVLPMSSPHFAGGDLDGDGDGDVVQHDGVGQLIVATRNGGAQGFVGTMSFVSAPSTVCLNQVVQQLTFIRVLDCNGVGVSGFPVQIALGSYAPNSVPLQSYTATSGYAGFFLPTPTVPGTHVLTAMSGGLTPVSFSIVVPPSSGFLSATMTPVAVPESNLPWTLGILFTNCLGQPNAGVAATLSDIHLGAPPVAESQFSTTNINGVAPFQLPATGQPGYHALTASVVGAPNLTVPIILDALKVRMVSGGGQVAPASSVLPSPLVFEVTDHADAPVANLTVVVHRSGILFADASDVTNAFGRATITAATAGPLLGSAFVGVSLLSLDQRKRLQFPLTIIGLRRVELVSGDGQSAMPGSAFAAPVVFRVVDAASGTPLANETISLASTPVVGSQSTISVPVTTAVTDSAGLVGITPTAASLTYGASTLTATYTHTPSVSTSQATALLRNEGTALTPRRAFVRALPGSTITPVALSVQVSGSPVAAEPLEFILPPGLFATASTTVITDASGLAAFTGTLAADVAAGRYIVPVRGQITGCSAEIQILVSTFRAGANGPGGKAGFYYRHDRSSLPFALVVDLAPAAPIATPFGEIWTSLLSTAPTFSVLDGTGLIGPLDPSMVATPEWHRNFALPPMTVGLNLVAQVYAYDPSVPYPASFVVSNPQFFGI